MVKILASLRNFRDRVRTSISIKTTNILIFMAIFLIVVLAIVIRLSPLIRGITLIKAFDPWIQWYNAEYLNNHSLYEYFHWVDYKSWYPDGTFRGGLRPGLTFTVVTLYKIFRFFGVPVSLYNICFAFPAFMGGMTVLVIYYLGKEVLNRGTGLFAAFFLAFNPGYLQRTTAGFFDNETIGVFASLMAFLFFLKAARTGKFSYSVLGGMFLGYLSLSWGGYEFIFLLLPLISIILILSKKYNENLLIAYAGVQGTGLLIFSLFISFDYGQLFSSLELGGIFLFTIILIIFHIIYTKRSEYSSFYDKLITLIKWLIIPGIIIVAIIIWVAPQLLPFEFSSRFWTILNPLAREQVAHVASVAEQMPSAWSVFYYNTLIPLILVPLGIYFCFKRLNVADIFLIAFILLMFYFTGSMIRIILIFAPAASLIGAYGLVSILKIFGSFLGERKVGVSRMRRKQVRGTLGSTEVVAVYLIVGFLCIAQVVHTSDIAVNQMSYAQMAPAGVIHEWEESLTWMRENLQGTDVVVSWWDYGYWLTPVGNVTTVNDNATANRTRMGLVGMALMQTNEIYSLKALQRLKADYILVYFGFLYTGLGGDEGKWTWMIQICNDAYAWYKQRGWEEDNWAENAVFDESQYRNMTHGYVDDAWFDSQLVKLMFYDVPTEQSEDQSQLINNYASEISRRIDNDGETWKSHIPADGQYQTIAFIPEFFSKYGMVKLFKVDYTALDSKFSIKNAEVFDNGYATFKLDNHGEKDLQITSVKINDLSYDFVMGNATNSIEKGSEDQVWVDIKSKGITFNEFDVVNVSVTAQSEALYGRTYTFTNNTSNFFVKKALPEEIKINRENSKVIQSTASSADIYLEVENIGDSTVFLDRFYKNSDTEENRFISDDIIYLNSSPIIKSGEKANIHLKDVEADFSLYPTIKYNKIGVSTVNNITDEVLFTSSLENYAVSIISSERITSPEIAATIDNHYRNHIPVDFNGTHAIRYENGTTLLTLHIKNTGDNQYGIESIYLNGVDDENKVLYEDYHQPVNLLLDVNQETVVVIDATDYINGDINEEILICVTTSFDPTTVASDIGYIHTIKDEDDIQIIEEIDGTTVSYINANETGKILVKNTGNGPITLENVIINNTLTLDCSNYNEIEFLYGDSSLDIQECALISFDIPGFQINKSNEVIVKITTNTTAEYETVFNAIVDSEFYRITVDPASRIDDSENRVYIKIVNNGLWNVTLDSIYINETYIPLSEFIFQVGDSFEIVNSGGSITIYLDNLEDFIGSFSTGDKFIILARTLEGAEDTQEELVVA